MPTELKRWRCNGTMDSGEECGSVYDEQGVVRTCQFPGCKRDVCPKCEIVSVIQVAQDRIIEVKSVHVCSAHANGVPARLAESLTDTVVTGLLRGRKVRSDAGKARAKRERKAAEQEKSEGGNE